MLKAIKILVNFLFPNYCKECGKMLGIEDKHCFCSTCWDKIELIKDLSLKCKICSRPVISDNEVCSDCKKRERRYFKQNISIGIYNNILKKAIKLYKFEKRYLISNDFIDLIKKNIEKDFIVKNDIIIGVPLSKNKEWERGFNQTYLIAKKLSKIYNLPFIKNLLIKVKDTPAQSELKAKERLHNLKDIFKIKKRYKNIIKDKKILLVDDIYTTGTTVNECAKVLKENFAKEINVLTIARSV